MRIDGPLKRCWLCGATLDVPDGVRPLSYIAGHSGRENERVLTVDDREVHRCIVRLRIET
jgi:hypothetical protein